MSLPVPFIKPGTYGYLKTKALAPPDVGEDEFDDLVSDAAQYGRVQFWDERYAKETDPFEWYYGYDFFKYIIREWVARESHVMVAGCGSSNMLEDMALDGYENIVGADLSRVAIANKKIRLGDRYPQISFFQGTMCDTNLPAASVDAIIDKALLDSLLCGGMGSVMVQQYIIECDRLLNDNGVLIIISHGNPEQRLLYLEQYDVDEPHFTTWFVEVQAVVKPKAFDDEDLDPGKVYIYCVFVFIISF